MIKLGVRAFHCTTVQFSRTVCAMNTPLVRQTWVVSAVLLNMFQQGIVLSYPSSLVPALTDPSSSIHTDMHTTSWLASCMGISCIFGFLISSILMETIGRKKTHIIGVLPGTFGWLLIYFAGGVPEIMCGRILAGITTGATVSLGPIIIGEFTSPQYRGVFLNLKTAAVGLGSMFGHILTHFLSWRNIAIVSVIPYLMILFIICTWPESPSWLASKQKYKKSEEAFFWLRGDNEAKEIRELITAQMDKLDLKLTVSKKYCVFYEKFKRKDFLKPLNIILISTVLLETSGKHIFPAYALQIINAVTNNKSNSFYYTLGLDIIITASAFSSSVLVKIVNRRTLLFSTGFSSLAVLSSVCLYLFLVSREIISNDRSWVSIILFVLYFILTNVGCTPISLALIGEVFPISHRGVGSAVSGIWISICLMLGLHLTPYMLIYFNVYGTFAVYGSIAALSLIVLYYALPETKNRTLQEIEYYFNHGEYRIDRTNGDCENNAILKDDIE